LTSKTSETDDNSNLTENFRNFRIFNVRPRLERRQIEEEFEGGEAGMGENR
jgi:hypothetical protein